MLVDINSSRSDEADVCEPFARLMSAAVDEWPVAAYSLYTTEKCARGYGGICSFELGCRDENVITHNIMYNIWVGICVCDADGEPISKCHSEIFDICHSSKRIALLNRFHHIQLGANRCIC